MDISNAPVEIRNLATKIHILVINTPNLDYLQVFKDINLQFSDESYIIIESTSTNLWRFDFEPKTFLVSEQDKNYIFAMLAGMYDKPVEDP